MTATTSFSTGTAIGGASGALLDGIVGSIDAYRHESTHQLQVLSGRAIGVLQMEYGAYMTNMLNPATHTTIQNVFNIFVNDWSINSSALWETIINIYPYGPIP